MECVILFRWPSGRVGIISDYDQEESERIHVLKNMDEAVDLAHNHDLLGSVDYQIVELDEL